jgi:hypothetical protein
MTGGNAGGGDIGAGDGVAVIGGASCIAGGSTFDPARRALSSLAAPWFFT